MTGKLILSRALVDEMLAHCRAGRPNEACGVLAWEAGELVAVIPMTNAEHSPVRYRFDPREQLEMYNQLRARGWDLGAVYHSHTRTEAYPSPTDVREAREEVPYVIVSLADERPSIRAFRILKANWADEEGEVEEIPLAVTRM
ncbi:MAG: Mov34/MPN/PAD-1 family protein [Actinomycetota bacterium]